MVQNLYNPANVSQAETISKLFKVTPIDTMTNGRCHTIHWEPLVKESDMIVFQFEVPKSRLYNDAGSKNYDDKIKVFVHDITAQVRMCYQSYIIFVVVVIMLLQALLNTKFVTIVLIILLCNSGLFSN